ncbi:HTTM domain-containing protein [Streptomyces sp. 2A115]|uniref:HTTM domain-containing protein n=1 Tax=Streptomyces sp. 2A115 TaxID=3457439 RepID=UPI003FD1D7E7
MSSVDRDPKSNATGDPKSTPTGSQMISRTSSPASSPASSRTSRYDGKDRVGQKLARAVTRVTGEALGPYQTAVIRIGFAVTWLLFLLREFPHREEMYGPDGPWSWDLAQQLIANNHAFTALIWADSQVWFEIVYALAVLSSALLMLGWRTRTMSVLFLIGVLSLQNRSIFMGDGGDNVIHLMAIYLVFTRCGQVWSLDERRERLAGEARARGERFSPDRVGPVLWALLGLALAAATLAGKLAVGRLLSDMIEAREEVFGPELAFLSWVLGPGLLPAILWGLWAALGLWWAVGRYARTAQPRIFLDVVANLAHNAALFVIMAEACLIYATAGWYKIQGSRWQDGTAVYYPLHLDYFSPWPVLSDLLSAHGTTVMLVTYGTVIVQVAFPFTLFNRQVKNVLLAAMMTEHAVIAVVLGLPFFSLAMIAADAVFLPTSFLRRLGGWVARARGRLFSGVGRTLPEPRAEASRAPATAEDRHVGFTA